MASLSISAPLKPSFLPCSSSSSSSFSTKQFRSPCLFLNPRRVTPRIRAAASSPQVFSPLLSALEEPVNAAMGGSSDAMSLLLGERIVFLGGEINDFMADAIVSQLLLLDAQDHTKDIRIYINSTGGSLNPIMAIYDVINMLKSDVSTIAVGTAASMAAIILGCGTRGKRFAFPNARIMLHQPVGSASGEVSDVEYHAVEILQNKNNVTKIISGFTGRPFKQVKRDIDRDFYMGPLEAVEYGVIDAVIDRDKMIELQETATRVKAKVNYAEITKDIAKYLTPEIPENEIY